jgi:PAS domain S-box-containing protein
VNTFSGATEAARELIQHLDDAVRLPQTSAEIAGDASRGHVPLLRRAIGALAARDRELTFLARHSPDAIARFDTQGRFIYVNPAMERLAGRPAEEMLGRAAREIVGFLKEAEGSLLLSLHRAIDEGEEQELELSHPAAGGAAFLKLSLVPTLGEDGQVESVLTVWREVAAEGWADHPSGTGDPSMFAAASGAGSACDGTDPDLTAPVDGGRLVPEMQGLAADFEALIENAADIVGVTAANGLTLYMSPSVKRLLGFTPARWWVALPSTSYIPMTGNDLP